MRILFLSFYYKPDICAGSFRNTPLAETISSHLSEDDFLHVLTTLPNRYRSFNKSAPRVERIGSMEIERIKIPPHQSGFKDQIISFKTFFFRTLKLTKNQSYDLVYASSSRLFTAFLGSVIARRKRIPLYLDIRDIFTDTMNEVFENRFLKWLSLPILRQLERSTFNYARHINLVSEGFREYFNRYKKPTYSFFSNGIDDEFLHTKPSHPQKKGIKIITYAGNIGDGQGLHKIVPQAAQKLGNAYKFKIIGDGGARKKLEKEVGRMGLGNVEIIDPVPRDKLKRYYESADYLFMHLNDYEAFKKVLPSKVFEYGAYDKPIIAGVSGYARKFMEENLSNIILFEPCNADQFVEKLEDYRPDYYYREDFIKKFKRQNIMLEMASSVTGLLND